MLLFSVILEIFPLFQKVINCVTLYVKVIFSCQVHFEFTYLILFFLPSKWSLWLLYRNMNVDQVHSHEKCFYLSCKRDISYVLSVKHFCNRNFRNIWNRYSSYNYRMLVFLRKGAITVIVVCTNRTSIGFDFTRFTIFILNSNKLFWFVLGSQSVYNCRLAALALTSPCARRSSRWLFVSEATTAAKLQAFHSNYKLSFELCCRVLNLTHMTN